MYLLSKPHFSDANILNIFSGGSLLPGHTVIRAGPNTPLAGYPTLVLSRIPDIRPKYDTELDIRSDTGYGA